MLLGEIKRVRNRVENLVDRYMLDVEMHGITAAQLNNPCRQTIVNALRGGLSTELLYELLCQFAVMNRNDPTIITDRDKVLYVELEGQTRRVNLYIGDLDGRLAVFDNDIKKVFVLVVTERYEFVPKPGSYIVERRRNDGQALGADSSSPDTRRVGQQTPALYYHIYQDLTTPAECIFRVEFVPAAMPESETPSPAEKQVQPAAAPLPEPGPLLMPPMAELEQTQIQSQLVPQPEPLLKMPPLVMPGFDADKTQTLHLDQKPAVQLPWPCPDPDKIFGGASLRRAPDPRDNFWGTRAREQSA